MSRAADEIDVTSVRISSTSNRVRVVAEARSDVLVDGRARVSSDGKRTTIDTVQSSLVVRVPADTAVAVGTTSARVEVRGRVGALAVVTESGRVEIDEAKTADVRTVSGRVEIAMVAETCRVRTQSGRVQVQATGDADVSTRSSRIELKEVSGKVRAHCISGRIEIEQISANDIDAETVSGRISVSLPRGARAYRRSSPEDSGVRPEGYDCTVHARSVTGRVEVSP